MPDVNYAGLSIEEMLKIADAHTDPFVRALARQLDAACYQLSTYRAMLGLTRDPESKPQLDLFKD